MVKKHGYYTRVDTMYLIKKNKKVFGRGYNKSAGLSRLRELLQRGRYNKNQFNVLITNKCCR